MTVTSNAGPSTEDTAAVAAVPQKIIAAWAAHDAAAFAGVFVEDGTMILPGQYQKGRAAIEGFMTAAFGGPFKGTQVTGDPIDLRFLGEDVAILLTQGGVIQAGETELRPERVIRASWLVVKKGGQWQLAAYQNSQRDAA